MKSIPPLIAACNRHIRQSILSVSVASVGLMLSIAQAQTPHRLAFRTDAPGEKKEITRWGVDIAMPDPENIHHGIMFMGKEKIGMIRVSFPIHTPLVDGEIPASLDEHFTSRLEMMKMLDKDIPVTMLPDSDRGVHPWFKNGKEVDPEKWLMLMASAQKKYGRKMMAIEPFNEADWGWGQGPLSNLAEIMAGMQTRKEFEDVQIFGPSTLSCDAGNQWYATLKNYLTESTTHCLGGSFYGYVRFIKTAAADGKIPYNPEVHNLVEVITGAQYGLKNATWWAKSELARGEFVKANAGVQIAYAEDPRAWSSAAVYRAPNGKIQAFFGSSERVGDTAHYKLLCEDRAVFINGEGPKKEFDITIKKNQELLVDIQWGADIQPKVQGKYVIVNVGTGKVLGVENARIENGARIRQMQYNKSDHQQWDIQPVDGIGDISYVRITNLHSNKTIDNSDWSQKEGTPIQQWGDGTVEPQMWYLDYAGNNNFYIRSRWSTKCMEPEKGSSEENALIVQTEHTDQKHQLWRLIPVSDLPIDFQAPQKPQGLKIKSKSTENHLSWTLGTEPDLSDYTIYRATQKGGSYEIIARGIKQPEYVDKIDAGKNYFYSIKAIDHSQNLSESSAETSNSSN